MSLRFEQYNSLLKTRDFLRALLDPKVRPKNITSLKKEVISCLRHFPSLEKSGKPIFSNDEFTEE